MRIDTLDLYTTDATWNLAAEEYVFEALPRDRSYFLLWQNEKAVIIGKYQNAAAEVNAQAVREEQIQVVRRLSGGGAVYHDMGNLNFTFITDAGAAKKIDMGAFCRPILDTLHELGVPAELNGRNDMTVNGRKFSGNAQYIRHGRVMHHGTILFDSDLSAVTRALQVDEDKIRSKGIRSVRSRVTNLRPFLPPACTLSAFRARLLSHMRRQAPGEARAFTEHDAAEIEKLRLARYSRWDWNYGASPACDLKKHRRIDGCGTVTALLSLDGGRIRSLHFQGDFFSTEEPELLAAGLVGLPLDEQALGEALRGMDPSLYFSGMTTEELLALLLY